MIEVAFAPSTLAVRFRWTELSSPQGRQPSFQLIRKNVRVQSIKRFYSVYKLNYKIIYKLVKIIRTNGEKSFFGYSKYNQFGKKLGYEAINEYRVTAKHPNGEILKGRIDVAISKDKIFIAFIEVETPNFNKDYLELRLNPKKRLEGLKRSRKEHDALPLTKGEEKLHMQQFEKDKESLGKKYTTQFGNKYVIGFGGKPSYDLSKTKLESISNKYIRIIISSIKANELNEDKIKKLLNTKSKEIIEILY